MLGAAGRMGNLVPEGSPCRGGQGVTVLRLSSEEAWGGLRAASSDHQDEPRPLQVLPTPGPGRAWCHVASGVNEGNQGMEICKKFGEKFVLFLLYEKNRL